MVQEGRLEFPSRHVSLLVVWRDKKKPFRENVALECMSYTLCLAIRILGEFELTWMIAYEQLVFFSRAQQYVHFAISFRRLCRAFRATPSNQVSSLPKSKNMPGGNLVAQGTTTCLHNRDGLPSTCLNPAWKGVSQLFFQLHTTYV